MPYPSPSAPSKHGTHPEQRLGCCLKCSRCRVSKTWTFPAAPGQNIFCTGICRWSRVSIAVHHESAVAGTTRTEELAGKARRPQAPAALSARTHLPGLNPHADLTAPGQSTCRRASTQRADQIGQLCFNCSLEQRFLQATLRPQRLHGARLRRRDFWQAFHQRGESLPRPNESVREAEGNCNSLHIERTFACAPSLYPAPGAI